MKTSKLLLKKCTQSVFVILALTMGATVKAKSEGTERSCPTSPVAIQNIKSVKRSDITIEVSKDQIREAYNYESAAAWKPNSNNRLWTVQTLASVRKHKAILDKIFEVEELCPGYAKATSVQQEKCWIRFFSAMMKHESNFKASTSFFEPAADVKLLGLFSLETKSCGLSEDELLSPLFNIACGIEIFSALAITAQGLDVCEKGEREGPAVYWASVRRPYYYGNFKLGLLDKIARYTQKYRD